MRRIIVGISVVITLAGATALVMGISAASAPTAAADSIVPDQFGGKEFIGNNFDRDPLPTPADQRQGSLGDSYLDSEGDPLTGAKPDLTDAVSGQSRVSNDAFRAAVASYANDYAKRVDSVADADCRDGADIEKQWGFAAREGRLVCAVVITGEFELARAVDGKTFTFARWVNYYDGITGNQLGSSMYPGDNQ